MKIFPSKEYSFKLISGQTETINRLERRTEKSKYLTSQPTDKSFRGVVEGNKFKVISSSFGKGAFCVMTGEIESEKGHVKVEINKAFKILLGVILVFPFVGFIATVLFGRDDFWGMILVALGQILLIRFFFIELGFRYLAMESLNRLRDVLDIEWIRN